MKDISGLAGAAFSEAAGTGALKDLSREDATALVSDAFGKDPAAAMAAMDEYDNQRIFAERDRLMEEDAADEEAMHMGVKETMLRTLGISDDEYARASVDQRLGDTSTMLALKEAYVFR